MNNKIQKSASSLLRAFASFENYLLVIVLVVMIVTPVSGIVLRNLFQVSIFWLEPLQKWSVVWVAVLGAMVATREREHIAIDIAAHYLQGKVKLYTQLLSYVFSGVMCSVMAYFSVLYVYESYMYPPYGSILPSWALEMILPLGMIVMALRFGAATVLSIRDMWR